MYMYISVCVYIYISCNISQSNLNTQYIFFLIFRSRPSDNCLYSSLSILLFGSNDCIDELGVLSSIELFIYRPSYCKHPCFLSLCQTFEKAFLKHTFLL